MTQGTAFGSALAGAAPQNGPSQYASAIGQDRIVRKEVSLGIIRDRTPPQDHIGLTIAPFLDVATDDVVFSYLGGLADGLAPARSEQAEAELAQKDENASGQGRASVIDWSLKDHYNASDVNKARQLADVVAELNAGNLPMFITSATADWQGKITRDRNLRLKKLDNRMEWLIMNALSSGTIVYDDGKIKFTVDYGRPATQQAGNAANDVPTKYRTGIVNGLVDFSGTTFDPIGFFTGVSTFMFDTYGVHMDRVIGSKRGHLFEHRRAGRRLDAVDDDVADLAARVAADDGQDRASADPPGKPIRGSKTLSPATTSWRSAFFPSCFTR